MKQGTYYLTEDEHRDFKAKCAKDGLSITEKLKMLILDYLNNPSRKEDTEKLESF